jgi:outer membrane receptor protein involved in Fe transport
MSFSGLAKKMFAMLAVVIFSVVMANPAIAGITGKISGKIIEKSSGEPLPGVNVIIDGTTMGAASDTEGRYSILNVRPGDYTVSASIIGYKKYSVEEIRVTADLTTTIDFALDEEVLEGEVVVIRAERPLVQRDQTATVRVTSSEEIENLPVRDYKEVVGISAGVVQFENNATVGQGRGGSPTSASNLPQLNVRGGRANQVAYIVDGSSVQDPITGNTTISIAPDAIDEVVVMTGGFNAEYGRIMSGAVNVTTKRGQKQYHGKVGALTDNVGLGSDPQDYNVYDLSLSGPLIPGNDKVNFFVSGSRTWQGNRVARAVIPSDYMDIVNGFNEVELSNGNTIAGYNQRFGGNVQKYSDGVLPGNWADSWSYQGKLGFDLSNNMKLDIGFLGSRDDYRSWSQSYLFNVEHTPYYEDRNAAFNTKLTYQMNKNTFMTVGGNYFATERFRGDGVHKKDQLAYGRVNGNPNFDDTVLFLSWDDIEGATETAYQKIGWDPDVWPQMAGADSIDFVSGGDEGYVFDDYLQRKSSYVGFNFNVTSQVHPNHEVKFGFDMQKHKMRYYRNLFPASRGHRFLDDPEFAELDTDQYGYLYDPIKNELVESDDPTGNGLDGPKEPTTMAVYMQDKFEYEGIVINFGLRYDYLDSATEQLVDENDPLRVYEGGSDSALEPEELTAADAQTAFSPRLGIGFPITDRTVLHASYGWFYQQPNLFDLYVSYAYLEHKIRTGGYFYPFGNPNLDWEKTVAYEVGLRHQLNDISVFEATAYYKSIEDLVQVRSIASQPESFSSYRNSDYGTVKGFDFSFQTLRNSNLAMNLAYTLSWATGTGSTSNSTRNIAWTGEEPPRTSAPLDYDQRHKFTFNADYRYSDNAPLSLLNNFGVNLLGSIASGTPYTPQKVYNEVTLGSVSPEPVGPINSRYGPWVFRMDMKANKSFNISGMDMNFYVWVLNLLDRDNATDVYEITGDPQSTSFLSTDEGRGVVEAPAVAVPHDSSGLTAEQKYLLREQDANNYDVGRVVRFGVELSF